jgi:hypothetical protein
MRWRGLIGVLAPPRFHVDQKFGRVEALNVATWPGLRPGTASLVLLLSGCAPKNIVRATCESEMLATGDSWACTLTGQSVEQASSIAFDTESRNQVARVALAVQVTSGALRLAYRDLGGDHQVTVTRDAPLALRMQTRLHRERRSFTLSFEPVNGKVEGVTGTVSYSTP